MKASDAGNYIRGPRRRRQQSASEESASVGAGLAPVADAAPPLPGGWSIRRLTDTGVISAEQVLGLQRTVGNQAVQRLFAGQTPSMVQRAYLKKPYVPFKDFNEVFGQYPGLKSAILRYRQAAKPDDRATALDAVVTAINSELPTTLASRVHEAYQVLRSEIEVERSPTSVAPQVTPPTRPQVDTAA